MAEVDNTASPHGGRLVERIAEPDEAEEAAATLKRVPVRGQIATECLSLAYGFFSPLLGFMTEADVDGVAKDMRLASGYVWSVPLLFDLAPEHVADLDVDEGDRLLLTYQDQPLAVLDVEQVYSYDKEFLARQIYGTTDEAHPGVRRTRAYQDRFLGGPITLVNPPRINEPFDRFFFTPPPDAGALRRERLATGGGLPVPQRAPCGARVADEVGLVRLRGRCRARQRGHRGEEGGRFDRRGGHPRPVDAL
jgi:sulfate adenylyltransferase